MMRELEDDVEGGLDQTRHYWDRRAGVPGTDLQKLEWSHERTQRLRFEAFVLEHDLNQKSVLDVGCGLADFLAHLRQRGVEAEYCGYDISPAMIRLCRARYPAVPFACGNFLDYQPPGRFDYTVAFGIHNIRVTAGQEILERVTRHQFSLSRIAAHVSLLTDRAAGFAPHIQTWRAEEVLAMALRITPHVMLRHDYLENDFSVTLYRQSLVKRRDDVLLAYERAR
jgi:SAM-dependent methyltransferase